MIPRRNAPRLRTVTELPTLRAPFGFMPARELPTRHTEFLTFTIPDQEMRVSEAKAWADSRALQWAEARATKVAEVIDWRIAEDSISALVTLTSAPQKPKRPTASHDPEGCQQCIDVAAYGDAPAAEIAAALGVNVRSIHRHRTIPPVDRRIKQP